MAAHIVDKHTTGDENQNSEVAQLKRILPPIKAKEKDIDSLPKNLLVTLTQAGKRFEDLGPGKKRRNKHSHTKADNLWNHEKSRSKFKHLLEQPACYCGAGKDISYLLDATGSKVTKSHIKENVKHEEETESQNHGKVAIPESIVPSEFHIVKHKGVVGLDVHDEKYSTKIENHAGHMTMFPSMKPSGRQEALQLMKMMNTLLKKAGVDKDILSKVNFADETNGNQIENLLNIVKNEQKIYNIVFNEIIRQVSIECVERGTVLAELRRRYANMLDRVPKQVKSLHEEVLAQRALDRRLTEELSRFKSSITLLTKELHEIHAHDEEVTKQAIETQAELNEALKESEKNASLLAEYHDLYELQRRRLDYQLSKLIEERDLWAGSALMLSLKVTVKHNLVTVRRLHLFEKAWYKIANRYASLLGQEDEKQLQILAGHVHKWQEITESFNEKLSNVEHATCEKIKSVRKTLLEWGKRFERVVTPDDGSVNPLDTSNIQDLFDVLKNWEELFNLEAERFTGDVLLSCEDDLLQMNTCVDLWIETAMKIFANHPHQDSEYHQQHTAMIKLNNQVEKLHQRFKLRMTGENGLAKGFIQFINSLATWVNKINVLLHGGDSLYESEWVQLADFIQVQWIDVTNNIIAVLSLEDEIVNDAALVKSQTNIPATCISVNAVCDVSQSWLNNTIDSFETENANIVEQVATTHSNMIRWMITILIRLAPDTIDKNGPSGMIGEEDQKDGLGAAILIESTSEAIIERATMLFNWLRSLTDLIVSCCKDLLLNEDRKSDAETKLDENTNLADLTKIETECQGWMSTANLLINELTGNSIPMDDFISNSARKKLQDHPEGDTGTRVTPIPSTRPTTVQSSTKDVTMETETMEDKGEDVDRHSDELSSEDKDGTEDNVALESNVTARTLDDDHTDIVAEMHVIGVDENVKKKSMESVIDESKKQEAKERLLNREDLISSSMSMESLRTLEKLQQQLMMTEERAQSAENRAFITESALKEAKERIRALERSISRSEVTPSARRNTTEAESQ